MHRSYVNSKTRFTHTVHQHQGSQDMYGRGGSSETSSSSAGEGVSFPFLPTPSGNLKVVPQQVVYESNQLSIVAADPRKTKVNIKASSSKQDMSGGDKQVYPLDLTTGGTKGRHSMEAGDESPGLGNMIRRQIRHMWDAPQQYPGRPGAAAKTRLADGDNEEVEYQQDQQKQQGKNKGPAVQELNLTKMGFNKRLEIDWKSIDLPPKTDLLKLIHYRISNFIKPDILVKIGNHEYRCHMLVLQCYSGFFAELAVSRIEIEEQNVTQSAFASIYNWMLHLGEGSFSLLDGDRESILEIFVGAQFLRVKELEEQCWAFIDNEDLFSEDRAFMLYLDARNMGNTAVMELMVPRVQRFFLTLVSSKDFLDLVVEEVAVFLSSNYICIHCEMEVFMSGVRWLMHDWERRKKYLLQVMSCVRFALISPWQLVDIRRNPENKEFLEITQHKEVSQMIEDGLAYAIIKYYCGNEGNHEYGHCIEVLNLVEPAPRNWSNESNPKDQKSYTSYQQFLKDLARYRISHLEKNHRHGDKLGKAALDDVDNYLDDMIC